MAARPGQDLYRRGDCLGDADRDQRQKGEPHPDLALAQVAQGTGELGAVDQRLGARALVAPRCFGLVPVALESRALVF